MKSCSIINSYEFSGHGGCHNYGHSGGFSHHPLCKELDKAKKYDRIKLIVQRIRLESELVSAFDEIESIVDED